MEYISLTEYCNKYEYNRPNTLKKVQAGRIPGARKIGVQWVIPADAGPLEDARVTNGHYKSWREKYGGQKRDKNESD